MENLTREIEARFDSFEYAVISLVDTLGHKLCIPKTIDRSDDEAVYGYLYEYFSNFLITAIGQFEESSVDMSLWSSCCDSLSNKSNEAINKLRKIRYSQTKLPVADYEFRYSNEVTVEIFQHNNLFYVGHEVTSLVYTESKYIYLGCFATDNEIDEFLVNKYGMNSIEFHNNYSSICGSDNRLYVSIEDYKKLNERKIA